MFLASRSQYDTAYSKRVVRSDEKKSDRIQFGKTLCSSELHFITFLTLSQTEQTLDSSKLKELGDDNFGFDENGRSFKRVENTVGKGEIARYEQFLLFPHCVFKRFVLQTPTNQGLLGKGLNQFCNTNCSKKDTRIKKKYINFIMLVSNIILKKNFNMNTLMITVVCPENGEEGTVS